MTEDISSTETAVLTYSPKEEYKCDNCKTNIVETRFGPNDVGLGIALILAREGKCMICGLKAISPDTMKKLLNP